MRVTIQPWSSKISILFLFSCFLLQVAVLWCCLSYAFLCSQSSPGRRLPATLTAL